MKCYRIYSENEVIATVFSLPAVADVMNTWSAAGYNVTFEVEDYENAEETATETAEEQNHDTTNAEEKESETMKMINLEALKLETRQEIGTDAAYLAADYEGCSSYICDAIRERADSETSIYYSDIIKYISGHVEEVNDVIQEFGWDGCGSDLYKAGQMAEFCQIESDYLDNVAGIIKYAAIMDLIYKRDMQEVSSETWEAIEAKLDDLDTDSRFDDITDIITEILEADTEEEAAGTLDTIKDRMIDGFNGIAAAVQNGNSPEVVTA